MDPVKETLDTFNECYPFEKYIFRNSIYLGTIYKDLQLTELFVPNTKIEPILDENGNYVCSTEINKNEVYVKLKSKIGELRFNLFDFAEYIREDICSFFIEDFGKYEYECLYVDHDPTDLNKVLDEEYNLIKEKYGSCINKFDNNVE